MFDIESSTHVFCASFSVCSTVVDRCVFLPCACCDNYPTVVTETSFYFFSMCIFDVMFGQGTAKTIEVGRIVGAPTTVCGWKSIVLLFYCLAVIVLLFDCLRVYCWLSTYCPAADSAGTHGGSTRDCCSTLWGGVSIGRIVYINT